MTNRADRERHVIQMLVSSRFLDGLEPDETDKLFLDAYIDGRASLDDLLTHARQFSTLAAYEKWQRTHVRSLVDNPKQNISSHQVMAEMRALIKRRHEK